MNFITITSNVNNTYAGGYIDGVLDVVGGFKKMENYKESVVDRDLVRYFIASDSYTERIKRALSKSTSIQLEIIKF